MNDSVKKLAALEHTLFDFLTSSLVLTSYFSGGHKVRSSGVENMHDRNVGRRMAQQQQRRQEFSSSNPRFT